MRKTRSTATLAATAISLMIVLMACTGSGGASQAVADPAASTGGDTISIASPVAGSEVSIPFDVQLESSVPLGEPETGNHHAHLYFDTGTDAADYDIVYGTTWQVTRQLAPGPHRITVALANPDHSLAGPTQTIDLVVGGGGAAGESVAPVPPAASPTY